MCVPLEATSVTYAALILLWLITSLLDLQALSERLWLMQAMRRVY